MQLLGILGLIKSFDIHTERYYYHAVEQSRKYQNISCLGSFLDINLQVRYMFLKLYIIETYNNFVEKLIKIVC